MKLKESGIIEIYTNDKTSFSVGRVYCQSNDYVVFEDIDKQGIITGYCMIRKDIISQTEDHTEYLDKLGKYMEYWEEHPYSAAFSLKHIALETEKPLILQVLQYAKDNDIIITIEMDSMEEPEAGYVKEIKQEGIIFSCIDISNTQIYDELSVEIFDINFIEFESIDNLLLKYAHDLLANKRCKKEHIS